MRHYAQRQMRLALLLTVGAVAAVPSPAQAGRHQTDTCRTLRWHAAGHAIDYGLERSTEGDLATAPHLDIDIVVEHCEPSSRRRALYDYRLKVRDREGIVIAERGTMVVTRARATFRPDVSG